MKTFKTILFYVASFTWGILMTLFGCICALGLLITGHKPKRFYQNIYFEIGNGWGGFEAGCFFICCKDSGLHLKQHESGHGIQNIILGPFMPFIVSIPSCIRYWLREIKSLKGKYIYASILGIMFIALSLGLFVPGIISNIIWMSVVGGLILFYSVVITIWLLLCEISQYTDAIQPAYDDIWFEHSATSLGEKYYK